MMLSQSIQILAIITIIGPAAARLHAAPQASRSDPPDADEEPPPDVPRESLVAAQFSPDPYEGLDRLDLIKSGTAKLASIRFLPESLSGGGDGYSGVYGEFCAYDLRSNATVEEIMLSSDHCNEHRFSLPLGEVVSSAVSLDETPRVAGLMFQQGRGGADLLSDSLAALDGARVVREHPALRDALSACDRVRNRFRSASCSPSKRRKLLRDALALVVGTSDAAERAYVQFHPESSVYIPEVLSLLPDAPWTFSYGDPEEALARAAAPRRDACARTRRDPSYAMRIKSNEFRVNLDELTKVEVCAIHLGAVLDVASASAKSGSGMLVERGEELSDGFLANELLPHFGLEEEVERNPSVGERVGEVISRSKARRRDGDEVIPISEEVRAASRAFMENSMEGLVGHKLSLFG